MLDTESTDQLQKYLLHLLRVDVAFSWFAFFCLLASPEPQANNGQWCLAKAYDKLYFNALEPDTEYPSVYSINKSGFS